MQFADGPALICPKRLLTKSVVEKVAQIGLGSDRYVIATEQEITFRYGRGPEDTANIDYVFLKPNGHLVSLQYALVEFQAVYFSGESTKEEYLELRKGHTVSPGERHADWKSSFLKRLLPQVLIKAKIAEALNVPLIIVAQSTGWETLPFRAAARPLSTPVVPRGQIAWVVFKPREIASSSSSPMFDLDFMGAHVINHQAMLETAYRTIEVSTAEQERFHRNLATWCSGTPR